MSEMRYAAPTTLEAAHALLAGASGPARVLAGGTDLMIRMRAGLIEPGLLVDIKGIPEMTSIVVEDGGFRFGAAVPCMELVEHAEFARTWPGVIDAIKLIGSTQVKGRATVGGNRLIFLEFTRVLRGRIFTKLNVPAYPVVLLFSLARPALS